MNYAVLPLYFIIGGTVVTLATYFGSRGKGLVAAFFAFFPSISAVSLCTVYLTGGIDPAASLVRGMLFLLPVWLVYGIALIYLLPRYKLSISLTTGIMIYMSLSFLVNMLLS